MSTDLDPVYEELKRLQLEGMDRVFIEDSTMALLKPMATPASPAVPPVVAIDLQSAVNSEEKPNAAAPKVTPPKDAVVTAAPLPDAPIIELPSADAATQMQWLKQQAENSPVVKERLREGEKMVFGEGSLTADIYFIVAMLPARKRQQWAVLSKESLVSSYAKY